MLKLALILEALLAYIYVSLTNGVFLTYLASLGYGASTMSFIVLISSLPAIIIGYLLFKDPHLLSSSSKANLVIPHAFERLTWLIVPFLTSLPGLIIVYAIKNLFSVLISLQINNIIFSCFDERGIRDVTSKRSSLASLSSILGYFLATVFLSRKEVGFYYCFTYGSLIGLVSTAIISLPKIELPKVLPPSVKAVSRIYSISLFQVLYVASSSLLSILWVAVLIKGLSLESYWVTMIGLIGTTVSVFASLFWGKASFKHYRFSLAFDALTPILILIAYNPLAQLGISAYTSFFSTASGFLGGFLYARYLNELGSIRASSLLMMLGGIGQLVGTLIGSLGREYYLPLAVSVSLLKIITLTIAFLTIPEVAIVPEEAARNYANTLYSVSVLGYKSSLELSKEALMMTLRIMALTFSLLTLYIIYRIVTILLGV
ncbi:MAG: hypothetical protein B6U69_03210 [Thermofilum sp. ex4484_15]|nr:MAG: hypothetical protein B6U69_03210 [Thermofilum sp. ex4484_15]